MPVSQVENFGLDVFQCFKLPVAVFRRKLTGIEIFSTQDLIDTFQTAPIEA